MFSCRGPAILATLLKDDDYRGHRRQKLKLAVETVHGCVTMSPSFKELVLRKGNTYINSFPSKFDAWRTVLAGWKSMTPIILSRHTKR